MKLQIIVVDSSSSCLEEDEIELSRKKCWLPDCLAHARRSRQTTWNSHFKHPVELGETEVKRRSNLLMDSRRFVVTWVQIIGVVRKDLFYQYKCDPQLGDQSSYSWSVFLKSWSSGRTGSFCSQGLFYMFGYKLEILCQVIGIGVQNAYARFSKVSSVIMYICMYVYSKRDC